MPNKIRLTEARGLDREALSGLMSAVANSLLLEDDEGNFLMVILPKEGEEEATSDFAEDLLMGAGFESSDGGATFSR